MQSLRIPPRVDAPPEPVMACQRVRGQFGGSAVYTFLLMPRVLSVNPNVYTVGVAVKGHTGIIFPQTDAQFTDRVAALRWLCRANEDSGLSTLDQTLADIDARYTDGRLMLASQSRGLLDADRQSAPVVVYIQCQPGFTYALVDPEAPNSIRPVFDRVQVRTHCEDEARRTCEMINSELGHSKALYSEAQQLASRHEADAQWLPSLCETWPERHCHQVVSLAAARAEKRLADTSVEA